MELFKTDERRVRDILSKKEIQFVIPRNQRDYVWEEKQWKEFFNDVTDCIELDDSSEFKTSEYFIGSCVLEKNKTDNEKESIVDGQQRITTITIVLSLLYDLFKDLGQDKLLDGVYSYLYKKNDDGNKEFYTLKNESLEPFYSEYLMYKGTDKEKINPKGEQQIRIRNCYNYFKEILEKYLIERNYTNENKVKFLIAFRKQILDLKIIEISVANDIDGYTVFEILNAKGKQLLLADRMKNIILKKLPRQFPIDQAKLKWEKIKNYLESVSNTENNFGSFLNHYWISNFKKLKGDDEIYYDFKSKISKDKIIDFLNDLEINAECYAEITLSKESKFDTKLKFSLNSFKIFRNTQVRPILLSLFHNYRIGKLKENELLRCVKKIENFHFVFSAICSVPTNKIEQVYYEYSPILKHTYSKIQFDNFITTLYKNKPDYDLFEANFIKLGYSNKNRSLKLNRSLVSYILQSIEYYKRGNQEFNINDMSIEHIINDNGNIETGMLGNLLPLASTINNNCDSQVFADKVLKYQNSHFIMVRDFLEHNKNKTNWDLKEVVKRTKRIAKLSYEEVWE